MALKVNQQIQLSKTLPLVYLVSWCRPDRLLCLTSPLDGDCGWSTSCDGTICWIMVCSGWCCCCCARYTIVACCGCGGWVTATCFCAESSFCATKCCCCLWSSAGFYFWYFLRFCGFFCGWGFFKKLKKKEKQTKNCKIKS